MNRDTLTKLGVRLDRLARPDAEVPIWIVRCGRELPPVAALVLSEEEKQRAHRFAFAETRRRYIAAHLATRVLMAEHFGIAPDEQRFGVAEGGKPFLQSRPEAQWSVSYSGEVAIVGVSRGNPIGVDIERIRPIDDAEELIDIHCSDEEKKSLPPIFESPDEASRWFLAAWVRKEACVKALGQGLAMPLSQVSCGSGHKMKEVRIGDCLLRTSVAFCMDDHIIGWATSINDEGQASAPTLDRTRSRGSMPSRMT